MRPSRRGADYAGLVFYPASPRAVTSNVAGALTSRAAGQIAMVGLFVDADDAVIDALVAAPERAAAARFGTPERVAQLRARFGKPVEGAARRQRQRCRTRAQPMPGRRT